MATIFYDTTEANVNASFKILPNQSSSYFVVTSGSLNTGSIVVWNGTRWVPQLTRQYGIFSDTTDQTASANTAYSMLLNTTEEANGISVVSGSRITFSQTGTYNIQFSAQIKKNNASSAEIDIWLQETGSNVSRSNTQLFIQGNNAAIAASWNWVRTFSSGSYAEIIWSTTDADVYLNYAAAQTTPTRPEVPSVIVTVTEV